jgi:cell surface protein SprA
LRYLCSLNCSGTDYDIDYMNGTVTLKGEAIALMSGDSKVNIDYQQKPLVGGGKRSLLGVGATLNLSPNSRVSGTYLYSAMGAPKYAPRLGEEPSRTMVADGSGYLWVGTDWILYGLRTDIAAAGG